MEENLAVARSERGYLAVIQVYVFQDILDAFGQPIYMEGERLGLLR